MELHQKFENLTESLEHQKTQITNLEKDVKELKAHKAGKSQIKQEKDMTTHVIQVIACN